MSYVVALMAGRIFDKKALLNGMVNYIFLEY